MTGFAQQLFIDRAELPENAQRGSILWPNVSRFINLGLFSYIDFAIADRLLLRDANCKSEEVALLICYLSAAVRSGHLCVKINNNSLLPSLESLLPPDSQSNPEFDPVELQNVASLIEKGSKELPTNIPCERSGDLFYFKRHLKLENNVFDNLTKLSKASPTYSIDESALNSQLSSLESQNVVLPEQLDAIRLASQSCVSAITGGPGTGKTYTVGHLLRTIWKSISRDKLSLFEIALAAPTGKAAANLQKSLTTVLHDLQGCPPLKATTLHQLLHISSKSTRRKDTSFKLNADLLIVDESSMIDIHLFSALFSAIKEGSRLILLGDPHQLPSVEAGALFSDLIQLSDKLNIPVGKLKKCLRSELKAIIELSAAINSGNADSVFHLFKGHEGIIYKNTEDLQDRLVAKQIVNEAERHFNTDLTSHLTEAEQLTALNNYRILSPLRKGSLGIEALNYQIYHHMVSKHTRNVVMSIPIMIVKNDHRLSLFNGETGILFRKNPFQDTLEGDYAVFPSADGDVNAQRTIPAALLPKYEYAYCLSVHKSQGSEFHHVLLLMPKGSETFGREVFYTGVTRARKIIEIWGDEETIREAINRPSVRQSGLQDRLSQIFV